MLLQPLLIHMMVYVGSHGLKQTCLSPPSDREALLQFSNKQWHVWREVGTRCGPGADAEQTTPVVASMTTTPHRIERIRENVIRNMNIEHIDRLYLSVPTTSASGEEMRIPVWLESLMRENATKICVLRTKDWGPVTKLFGALHSKDIPDTAKIITLDDDRHYEPKLILKLLEASKAHPNFVITNSAWPIETALPGGVSSIQGKRGDSYSTEGETDVVLGCGGVLYPNKMIFDAKIFDTNNTAGDLCFKTDDIWISGHLERLGIKRWVIVDEDPARLLTDTPQLDGGDWVPCMSAMRDQFGIFK
eukprot:gnl/TRDRNA2_/TRDRNA2_193724_c0_seq1.p1 gnl/TRDRNA2_/TRDRNA2_193724_c0~~gnl/TRDRNA2_/TRDRNA2_193724_c0_seq1.p1  ORF type:complete len:304 (+),score=21.47 gnl/TRDRNA2_/TRDRNA2_193724_c0_seq1:68-979(+)